MVVGVCLLDLPIDLSKNKSGMQKLLRKRFMITHCTVRVEQHARAEH